jgi:hypothetical protein
MGVPASEVGYTSATPGRGDHEVHKGHVVALKKTISYGKIRLDDKVVGLSELDKTQRNIGLLGAVLKVVS